MEPGDRQRHAGGIVVCAASVSMVWPGMDEALFPAPGVYTLKLRLGETESAPAVVRVDP